MFVVGRSVELRRERGEKRAEDVLYGFGICGEEMEDDVGVWEG